MTCPSHLWRRAALLLAAVALVVFAAACDFFVSESSIQSVTISPPGVLLQGGASPADTFTLTANAKTVGGSTISPDTNAQWSSSDTTVATVDTTGVLTAVTSAGCQTTTITATDGGQRGTATVITYTGTIPSTVGVNAPSRITPTAVAPGSIFKVTATANLACNATQSVSSLVTWSLSSNTAGATIDSVGNVTVPASAGVGTTFTVNAVVQLGKASGSTTQATGTLSFTIA